MRVPFGEWLPDLPPLGNPGALEARNVIAEAVSYRPLRSLVEYTDALGSTILGVFWAQDSSNNLFGFAGTATALYSLQADGTWVDVTRTVGGAYSATNWEFTKFGDRVIAVNQSDVPQYFDMGTSTDFAALPGSPPQAARIAAVKDFVMLGDLTTGPATVQWAGFNASELWTPDPATMADFQELFGRGGRVQRIVPGDVGIVFREHSIHVFNPVGPPLIFENLELERGRGTPAPNSVIWTGDLVFYYGHDGFYRFDGRQSIPIGEGRVNRWFARTCDPGAISAIRGAIDRVNRLAIWAFSTTGGVNDRLLIFNWASNRWSYAEVNTQFLSDFVSSGYTLETLDTLYPGGLDTINASLDSPDFQGGALTFVAATESNALATFTGAPLTGVVDTKEFDSSGFERDYDPRRLLLQKVRPLVAGASPTVEVRLGSRDRLDQGEPMFDSPVALNETGVANVYRDRRYHRVRLEISGDYDHAAAVEVTGRPTGEH